LFEKALEDPLERCKQWNIDMKLKSCKSSGSDQVPAGLIQAGGRIVRSEIHKFLFGIRKNCPFFLYGEGSRSRCYGRTTALRLFVQPYDEDEDEQFLLPSFTINGAPVE
jgi:hypothetical protein